jgi:hypothetical protein
LRITAAQSADAMRFCEAQYDAFGCTWPTNGRTADLINDACVRIGISMQQLKRQFSKVDSIRRGRGSASDRSKKDCEQYEEKLLVLIDNGVEIMESAFVSAKSDKRLGARVSYPARLAALKDSPEIVSASLQMLKFYAKKSAEAWYGGGTGACELAFSAARRITLRPCVKLIFRGMFGENETYEANAIGVVFEMLLYEAFCSVIVPFKKVPLEVPQSSVAISHSTAQEESLCYISGYLIASIRKKFVQHGSELLLARWASSFMDFAAVPERIAIGGGFKTGKIRQLSNGGLVYPHPVFYSFVLKFENAWVHNESPSNRAAYGSGLNKEIESLLLRSTYFEEHFAAMTLALFPAQHEHALSAPKVVYTRLLEQFVRLRHKDHCKSMNEHHALHRRLDSSADNVPLRRAIASVSGAAASKLVTEKAANRAAARPTFSPVEPFALPVSLPTGHEPNIAPLQPTLFDFARLPACQPAGSPAVSHDQPVDPPAASPVLQRRFSPDEAVRIVTFQTRVSLERSSRPPSL